MNKVGLLFPGQGSQYIGMGKALCSKFPIAKQTFEEAGECLGYDVQTLCFEGEQEVLNRTEYAQPAILTASIASFRVFMQEIGIEAELMAGHSLGEYSALTAAGAVAFSDALRIVRLRGKLMQEASAQGEGAMYAINGLAPALVEEECTEACSDKYAVVVSNYNSPQQTVISGHREAVELAGERLKQRGAVVIPLQVSAPFHSPLMQPAAGKLEVQLQEIAFRAPCCPVLSNVSAEPYVRETEIAKLLTRQMTEPVRWDASMQALRRMEIDTAVEIGPQTVLTNLLKRNWPDIRAFAFDREDDVRRLRQMTGAGKSNSRKAPQPSANVVTKCLAIAVCTRNRNWNNDEYQHGVVEPYRRVQQIQDELDRTGSEPTPHQMREALQMLRSVFETKQVPWEERVERFHQVFDETGTRSQFPDFDFGGLVWKG